MAKKAVDIDWIINNYIAFFSKFGMQEQNIRNHFAEWKQKKEIVIVNDYLWYIFQKLLIAVAQQATSEEQVYTYNKEIYSKMCEFLIRIEERNANHVLKKKFENELRLWKLRATFKTEVEIISGHCCDFCNSLHKKLISFEEALEKQYLASSKCTRKCGCNCCYAEVSIRDQNGRLIPIIS